MRRRVALVLLGGLAAALLGYAPDGEAAPARSGLPAGVPPAALRAEQPLPRPAGWQGSEAFARTSGSGRLDGGSLLWTDWLYDDHGGVGVPTNPVETAGTPNPFGSWGYPAGPAAGNGADVFRAGVHLTPTATQWRVDWNTLLDPAVPLAVWTFDTDADPATGVAAWPAGAGVTSPGLERALVVSARGATLLDLTGSTPPRALPTTVDRAARSFVVTVPRRDLPVQGRWTVRLGAGLADADGAALAAPTGAPPGSARLLNVTFRHHSQEQKQFSFWNDWQQAQALTRGDVSAFDQPLVWRDLATRRTTAQERPRGWSTRWFRSSQDLGQGRVTDPAGIADGAPAYLGRVQPYSIYLPRDLPSPAPLTFLLHSLTQNHNQYAATTPELVELACERRRSVCVTTLGRGGDGSYRGVAEVDFWEVWSQASRVVPLDPERTVIGGYSMGGIGAHRIAAAHPDLFAGVFGLAGWAPDLTRLQNLREVPVYLAGGVADELQPVQEAQAEVDELDRLGFRYRWLVHATDHVAYELQDDFADAAAWMGERRRTTTPRRVVLSFDPRDTDRRLGVGVTGAYWVTGVTARAGATDALLVARSDGLAESRVVSSASRSFAVTQDPQPAVVTERTWGLGRPTVPRPRLELALTGVGAVTVDRSRAGLAGTSLELVVTSDSPVRVRLERPGRDAVVLTLPAGRSSRFVPR